MKEYVMIPFQVEENKIEEAKEAINTLISNIKENEPGTLMYKSLQMHNDPSSFINFMVFADNEAHMSHRSASHVVQFVKTLYSICPKEPFPIFMNNFDSCGIADEALEK